MLCVCVCQIMVCKPPPPPDTHTPASPPPLGVCGVNQGQWGSVGRHHHVSHLRPPLCARTHTPWGFVCIASVHPSRRPHHACLSSVKLGLSSAPRINYWGTHRVFDLHRRTNWNLIELCLSRLMKSHHWNRQSFSHGCCPIATQLRHSDSTSLLILIGWMTAQKDAWIGIETNNSWFG